MLFIFNNYFRKTSQFFKTLFKSLYLFYCLFLAVLGLCCCASFSLVALSQGYTLAVVLRPVFAVVSCVAEQRLQGAWASGVRAHGLSGCSSQTLEHRFKSCGARAYSFCGMWDLPRPGIEPVSYRLKDALPMSTEGSPNTTLMLLFGLQAHYSWKTKVTAAGLFFHGNSLFRFIQFTSVQSLSRVRLFVTP